MELVHEYQQTHRFHLTYVFIQIFVEQTSLHVMRFVSLLDFNRVQSMKRQFSQQLNVKPLLLLQPPSLLRKTNSFAVALVQNNLRVASDQHQHVFTLPLLIDFTPVSLFKLTIFNTMFFVLLMLFHNRL